MHRVLIRGGGDLATGVALRLYRAGCRPAIAELPEPLAVRRTVAFCEAVYEGEWPVEGVTARRADSLDQALGFAERGLVPVLVAPRIPDLWWSSFQAVVDARLTKRPPETDKSVAALVVGLGPGFVAGRDCHAVVETQRGHRLGRVLWSGSAQPDTAVPDGDPRRVLRSPADGRLRAHLEIGQHVEAGQPIADVEGVPVPSPLSGMLRGLIRPGLAVSRGLKIGDIDPRDVREHCYTVSDRALAVGGGVLEALWTPPGLQR